MAGGGGGVGFLVMNRKRCIYSGTPPYGHLDNTVAIYSRIFKEFHVLKENFSITVRDDIYIPVVY